VEENMVIRIGIDIAVRAPHQASVADEAGVFAFSGHRFRTTPNDLERLWARLPNVADPGEIEVIMEPTRNAWVPLAAWFRRKGARVFLVPPERSADLRAYYAKHIKSDRMDSRLLARLPMLHPDGLHPETGLGPGDRLRRATKLHGTLTMRRSQNLARIDALLEILGPRWHAAFNGRLANLTPLRFLAAGYADPHTVKRLGVTRVTRFLVRHSRNAWNHPEAEQIMAAARESIDLWADGLDFGDLAEDIAIEARLALQLTAELKDLDERIALLLDEVDPDGILQSVPGIGPVTAAVIAGRIGDPNRFTSLAAVRSYSGLVPSLTSSGASGGHGGPTKRGDALLRAALFSAADQARKIDPQIAATYQRLIVTTGKHHTSATCTIAATLLTRAVACWRAGTPYVIRDTDGTQITTAQGRATVTEHYTVPADIRSARSRLNGTGRRRKESQGAPSTGPSATKARATIPA
jgi:transposase